MQIPYLEFLVELSWPDGNLIKEYTILLDPPPPNLKAETRPKALSQIAEQAAQAQAKSFGVSNPVQAQIEMQAAAQQRAAAEASLTNIVHPAGSNKFSDQTFDVVTTQPKTQLVPGVVPEVLEEEQKEAAAREAYSLQMRNFEQQQEVKAEKKQEKAETSLLSQVVTDLEDAKTGMKNSVSIDDILAEERKQDQQAAGAPATSTTAPAVGDEANINFNQVIKPVGPPNAAVPAPSVQPGNVGSVQPTPAAVVPPVTIKPAPSGHHLFYLGLILSLFLIAAGIAVAVKRGMKFGLILKRKEQIPEDIIPPEVTAEVPVQEKPAADVLDTTLDSLTPEDVDAEHIELATTPEEQAAADAAAALSASAEPAATTEEVEKLEQEFENIDLDQLGTPPATPEEIESLSPTLASEMSPPPSKLETAAIAPTLVTPTLGIEPEDSIELTPVPPAAEPPAAATVAPSPVTESPPQPVESGGLKLSEEGAALITPSTTPTPGAASAPTSNVLDNSEAMQKKLDLAKQYLDAGDKESAKELLNEVVETANDDQKLEAQILLSSIV